MPKNISNTEQQRFLSTSNNLWLYRGCIQHDDGKLLYMEKLHSSSVQTGLERAEVIGQLPYFLYIDLDQQCNTLWTVCHSISWQASFPCRRYDHRFRSLVKGTSTFVRRHRNEKNSYHELSTSSSSVHTNLKPSPIKIYQNVTVTKNVCIEVDERLLQKCMYRQCYKRWDGARDTT